MLGLRRCKGEADNDLPQPGPPKRPLFCSEFAQPVSQDEQIAKASCPPSVRGKHIEFGVDRFWHVPLDSPQFELTDADLLASRHCAPQRAQ